MVQRKFWRGKKVFLTGHTGFKGAWLSLWLHSMGAQVTGYSLAPPTVPSLFSAARIGRLIRSLRGDVRDLRRLAGAVASARPDIAFHLAAQPLVRESYKDPLETYAVNVMGTAHFLEAVRRVKNARAAIVVTSDKCYENREDGRRYREDDSLGGYDPYSNSKACAELVTAAYRSSFFNPDAFRKHRVALASARAGNVIGGGDWAVDRLIPDCVRALSTGRKVMIRNPAAVRPWQHVLEPLDGYLVLAEKLFLEGPRYAEAWNFGPQEKDAKPVLAIVKRLCALWGDGAAYSVDRSPHVHEAKYLRLNWKKARTRLRWYPRWSLDTALDKVVEWTMDYQARQDPREICLRQIREYANE